MGQCQMWQKTMDAYLPYDILLITTMEICVARCFFPLCCLDPVDHDRSLEIHCWYCVTLSDVHRSDPIALVWYKGCSRWLHHLAPWKLEPWPCWSWYSLCPDAMPSMLCVLCWCFMMFHDFLLSSSKYRYLHIRFTAPFSSFSRMWQGSSLDWAILAAMPIKASAVPHEPPYVTTNRKMQIVPKCTEACAGLIGRKFTSTANQTIFKQ